MHRTLTQYGLHGMLTIKQPTCKSNKNGISFARDSVSYGIRATGAWTHLRTCERGITQPLLLQQGLL